MDVFSNLYRIKYDEVILMSTHNIHFHAEIVKNIKYNVSLNICFHELSE